MVSSVMEILQSLVPLLPTLVIAYCLIKILSSGLNLISKLISALLMVGVTYLIWAYVAPCFGVHLPVVQLTKMFNW